MSDLDFSLPPRARIAWVSDSARDTWGPRLARVERALHEVAWISVAEGVRKCAIVQMAASEHVISGVDWLRMGLHYLPIEYHESGDAMFSGFSSKRAREPYLLRLVVATEACLLRFIDALANEDADALHRLMGWPACCSRAAEQSSAEFETVDPLFPSDATDGSSESSCRASADSPYRTNVLLRSVGLTLLSHVPCRSTCHDSVDLAEQLMEIGRGCGFGDEIEWMVEVLSWPVEWSALFGIVEIKTPLMKIVTATDAWSCRCVMQREGIGYPDEGARALVFPYAT